MKNQLIGKKGTEEVPSALVDVVLTIIVILVFAVILTNIFFGGLTSSEQKARIALISIAEAIPDHLGGDVFKKVEVNLPESYGIFSQPLGNGLTNLTLYKLKDDKPDKFIDNKIVKIDNIFRGFLPAKNCAGNTINEECKSSGLDKIYCQPYGEQGTFLGSNAVYCVYTDSLKGGIYTLIYKQGCTFSHNEIKGYAESCHLFGTEKAPEQISL